MVISSELYEDNPWWKSPDKIDDDNKITEWNNSQIKWKPRIIHTFDFSKDIVYSLRGPRQVGKTTLIKLQIKDFLSQGVSPWNIMYYAFDVDNTPKNLVEVIKNYLDNTKTRRGKRRCFLFLDEVSSIKDWQRGIKRLWDQNRLRNCTIIATGSHTVDLKISTEKLPGRRGITSDSLDKIMPPMKFSEYVSVIDPELKQKITDSGLLRAHSRTQIFKKLAESKIDKKFEELQGYLGDLNKYLFDYMLTGGIPRVVDEYVKRGQIDEGTYTTYLNAVLGDLNNLSRNETIFRQLVENVIKSIGWTTSWRSLQKDTDIGGQNTVPEYVNTLQEMFVLSVFYQYDSEKKKGLFQKEKKVRFHDPFFLHVLNGWIHNKDSFNLANSFVENPTNQGNLIEGIVGDHLIRLAFSLTTKKQTFVYSNSLFFWKYGSQEEVDYVFNDGSGIEIPIEVKFQNKITVRDLDGIINFKRYTHVKNAILLSKDKIGIERECVIVPTSMFLLLA